MLELVMLMPLESALDAPLSYRSDINIFFIFWKKTVEVRNHFQSKEICEPFYY